MRSRIDARSLSGGQASTAMALRRAGIGYVEVVGGETSPAELRRVVEKLVSKETV
jgi:hypothetical protein